MSHGSVAPVAPHPAITRDAIAAAMARIGPYVRRTPVLRLPAGALGLDLPLVLKLEHLQVSGSFKARGAFLSLLQGELPEAGVIAASGGNHGVAVACAARTLGVRAEIFVPEIASPTKVARLRALGAEVFVGGAAYAEALARSGQRAATTGARVVHAFDQVPTVLGQGTVGLEFAQQAPEVETVLVAVGGGGLIAGMAGHLRGDVDLVGVEPRRAPSLHAARAAGRPVDVEVSGLAADSLGARRLGDIAFAMTQAFVCQAVLVEDDDLVAAQRLLWDELRLAVEPAAAAPLAALRTGALRPAPGRPMGLVLCGGNLDPASLA